MFTKIKNWWKSRKQPKVWAVYMNGRWAKAVTYKKPAVYFAEYLTGPFRSEVDCEEYCDMRNGYRSTYITKKQHERT